MSGESRGRPSAGSARAGRLSDARLASGTGRSASQWFAILDGLGANRWSHAQIAARLEDEYEVPRWWAQGITVSYEQARGLSVPGQQPDGTYRVTVSRSRRAGPLELFERALGPVARYAGGDPSSSSRAAAGPSATWTLGAGESLLLAVLPAHGDACAVTLTQSGLRLPERMQPVEDALTALLTALP
ncbi:hypothetical protein ACPEEZ_03710 [Frigoribacterium sp. 2-23]|uniref:hypothetical protein n=1 Tax=Frigoribacterium sp. 2-23 TaxID=3415006 RepID=UPI003C6ECC98